MQIKLERYSYSATETEGELLMRIGGQVLSYATIERPWIPNPNGAKGGTPMVSCVPDGAYVLSPWTRPNGDKVYILYSPELGVYRTPDEHEPGRGRNLILIHKANWADQVNGCIAPGMMRSPMVRNGSVQQAVGMSGVAMQHLWFNLGRDKEHTLLITNECGASDVTI